LHVALSIAAASKADARHAVTRLALALGGRVGAGGWSQCSTSSPVSASTQLAISSAVGSSFDGVRGGGDGGVSGRRDGGEEGAVYDRSSDDATATARAWYAKKAATSPKKRGPPPMMSAAAANGAAPRVVLEPDYRLAGALAGGAGLVTLGIPLGLGVPLGVPLAALGALLASRTNTARLVFDVGQPVKRVSLAGGIACYPATPAAWAARLVESESWAAAALRTPEERLRRADPSGSTRRRRLPTSPIWPRWTRSR